MTNTVPAKSEAERFRLLLYTDPATALEPFLVANHLGYEGTCKRCLSGQIINHAGEGSLCPTCQPGHWLPVPMPPKLEVKGPTQ